jgi:hypothetical protein
MNGWVYTTFARYQAHHCNSSHFHWNEPLRVAPILWDLLFYTICCSFLLLSVGNIQHICVMPARDYSQVQAG